MNGALDVVLRDSSRLVLEPCAETFLFMENGRQDIKQMSSFVTSRYVYLHTVIIFS